jgi:hypothetical protein
MTTSFTASGKPKRSLESIRVERQYANVIRLFLAGHHWLTLTLSHLAWQNSHSRPHALGDRCSQSIPASRSSMVGAFAVFE